MTGRREFFRRLLALGAGMLAVRAMSRTASPISPAPVTGMDLASGTDKTAVVVFRGRGFEVLEESTWMTVRINGRPVRLLRSRKVPPGYLVQFDDGRVIVASGLSKAEVARRLAGLRS